MGCLPLTSAPLPAWPVRGWGEFDPTLPVSTGRTWDSTKGTGWPPDSGTRDPALRRGLGSPCRPGWRVPLSAPALPSLLSDHPSPPAPSLCSPLRPSATWRSATDLLLNFPRVLVPACGRDPSCSCREQGLTSPIHGSAGPNGRINRVASTRRQAESWPKAGACKHEWPRPGVGCSPPPPHPTALPSTGPAADSPSPHQREGRAGSFPPGPLGSRGSKRVGPTRPTSESRPDPSPLPGGLRALRRPPQSRAGRARSPATAPSSGSDKAPSPRPPTLTAQRPWPQHPPLLLHTCPRARVAACWGVRFPNVGLKAGGSSCSGVLALHPSE